MLTVSLCLSLALARIMSWPGLTKHSRSVKTFKKKLYRAVIRGDVDAAQKLLDDASDTYGIASVNDLYRTPVLWCYAFAMSCKNPLHVAAMLGNTTMVHLLLLHGFDVNALDKVARVNFNLGLIFKICTRILVRGAVGCSEAETPSPHSVSWPRDSCDLLSCDATTRSGRRTDSSRRSKRSSAQCSCRRSTALLQVAT